MRLPSSRPLAGASMIDIRETAFDPEAELAAFRARAGDCGAMASFLGLVRGEGGVETLTLEHFEGVTQSAITEHVRAAKARFDIGEYLILHRVGEMHPSEPIVLVACTAAHRRAAFDAVDYLMDYLKSQAPFWKKERRSGQERWITPRDEDYSDLARWTRPEQER